MQHGLRLAVGCGGNTEYPKFTLRDVNLDIRLPSAREIKDFVLADATHMPFREKTFKEICCAHIIEHLDDPEALILECKRVGESYDIVFPKWFSAAAYIDPDHKWVWFRGKFRPIPHILSSVVRLLFANRFADRVFSCATISQFGESRLTHTTRQECTDS